MLFKIFNLYIAVGFVLGAYAWLTSDNLSLDTLYVGVLIGILWPLWLLLLLMFTN